MALNPIFNFNACHQFKMFYIVGNNSKTIMKGCGSYVKLVRI